VTYETVSGIVNSDWFISDLTKIEIQILNKEILSEESKVLIKIMAQIETDSLTYLPKNETSFNVVLQPIPAVNVNN
jgi:hypothetical protein